jgi:hypothetical protein
MDLDFQRPKVTAYVLPSSFFPKFFQATFMALLPSEIRYPLFDVWLSPFPKLHQQESCLACFVSEIRLGNLLCVVSFVPREIGTRTLSCLLLSGNITPSSIMALLASFQNTTLRDDSWTVLLFLKFDLVICNVWSPLFQISHSLMDDWPYLPFKLDFFSAMPGAFLEHDFGLCYGWLSSF